MTPAAETLKRWFGTGVLVLGIVAFAGFILLLVVIPLVWLLGAALADPLTAATPPQVVSANDDLHVDVMLANLAWLGWGLVVLAVVGVGCIGAGALADIGGARLRAWREHLTDENNDS